MTTMLGPATLIPADGSASVSERHFEKDSWATSMPPPTLAEKLRVGLTGLSAAEKTWLTTVGDGLGEGVGEGAGADPTSGEGADIAVAEPALLEAVTATSSV